MPEGVPRLIDYFARALAPEDAALRLVLPLSRPGTVILADNVVRGRAVADPASRDPSVRGVQAYLAMVAEDPRLEATEPQTAGEKGWDGFALLPLRTA
jgi:predicted O-methyltransferase YrrM